MSRINQLSPADSPYRSVWFWILRNWLRAGSLHWFTGTRRTNLRDTRNIGSRNLIRNHRVPSSAKPYRRSMKFFGSKTWPDNEVIGAAVNHRPIRVINVQTDKCRS